MMNSVPLRLYDRSRTVQDWKCPRSRYLGYEYEGKGLTSSHKSLELFLGTVIHDGLSGIARGVEIDTLVEATKEEINKTLLDSMSGEIVDGVFILEQQALVEGLLRGFYKSQWPRLREQYPNILFIEEEMIYTHPESGIIFMAKPDLVLADNEGNAIYIEYKSTSSKREDWVNSWPSAVQIHSTCKAIEESKGVKITATIVQGLYKGYVSYGKQSSPFCYAYIRKGNPPFTMDEVGYVYKAGLRKTPTWELEGGVKKWVEEMSENILMEQFPQTPPIFVNEKLVESFFKQREVREQDIHLSVELIKNAKGDESTINRLLDIAFPQHFDQCVPSFGHPCGFRHICHGRVDDPLKHGYVYREPHHIPEAEMWKEREREVDTPYWDDSMGVVVSPEVV